MSNFDQLKHSLQPSGTTPVFDIDQRTGFMAPRPPVPRLPETWEIWERALDTAVERKIQLGDKIGLTSAEAADSHCWRNGVLQVRITRISPDHTSQYPRCLSCPLLGLVAPQFSCGEHMSF